LTPRILVVDDEKVVCDSLRDGLQDNGYQVDTAGSGEEAVALFAARPYSLVLLDLRLPDRDGLQVLQELKEIDHFSTVIMMTGKGDESTAFKAAKLGAYNYVMKPFELSSILLMVKNALEKSQLWGEVERLRRVVDDIYMPDRIIGESRAIKNVFQFIDRVSRSKTSTVLIQGESGTGKELVARAIHNSTPDTKDSPFIEVNCAAMPETLLESELFGYEQGAFTDAKRSKKGIVELADTGTLFLDEIGEMNLGLQGKLLRFIETKRFKRIGGQRDITVDVRIIAATNRDLRALMEKGEFRSDLYYRLSVLPVTIPPLRERKDDIILLAEYFIEKFNREFNRRVRGLSPEAAYYLANYSYPGNVRELRNVIERIMILETGDEILPEHLPREITGDSGRRMVPGGGQGTDFRPMDLAEMEYRFICRTVEYFKGNKSQAARALGISRQTLREKLKRGESLQRE